MITLAEHPRAVKKHFSLYSRVKIATEKAKGFIKKTLRSYFLVMGTCLTSSRDCYVRTMVDCSRMAVTDTIPQGTFMFSPIHDEGPHNPILFRKIMQRNMLDRDSRAQRTVIDRRRLSYTASGLRMHDSRKLKVCATIYEERPCYFY
ncbi:hypothetical protein SUGI_0560830 [Cryptomeria japonica]|nr:hypothetical protein SUGI_0560830 [Cryptomeria japonica]